MKTMRMLPAAFAIALVAVAAQPAYAQTDATVAQAPAVDPVGMYDFIASLGIEMRTGTLELERNAEGHIVGEAWLEGESAPALIDNAIITGNHVELQAWVNGSNPVTFELDFAEAEFAGVIIAGGDSIEVDGTRRP